jgi:O-antigen ligase
MVITWLLEGDFVGKARRLASSKHRLMTLLFAGLYVFYSIGLFYTMNFEYGLFDMEVKMSLFIFPVIMASIHDELLQPNIARKILWAFVFGVFSAMALDYAVAIWNYLNTGSVLAFYYSSLSVLIHPTYMSMYASFAIAILLYFLLKGRISGRLKQVLTILLIILFELFVVMLSSKAGILSLSMVIGLFVFYQILESKKRLKALLKGAALAASFIALFLLFPLSSQRFDQAREALGQVDVNAEEMANSSGERIMIWWYSFEITNENFLFGVGTGDVKDALLDKYKEKEMQNALSLELNAHSQYLQMLIALGSLGLTILLLNLIIPGLYAIERKHYLYFIFLLLIGFNFLFESMLETQAGVVFYAFFNAYLFAIKKDPASLETESL